MSRVVLVTGGARSGKSSFAESLLKDFRDVVYIATARVSDDEMRERILLHQQSRPKEWQTYEASEQLVKAVGNSKHYLLDCLTILSSNIMFDLTQGMERIEMAAQKKVEETIVREIEELIRKIRSINGDLVIVTNEVGSCIVPETHIGRVFRDIIGKVNQRVAALCDEVYFVVCGIPQRIK